MEEREERHHLCLENDGDPLPNRCPGLHQLGARDDGAEPDKFATIWICCSFSWRRMVFGSPVVKEAERNSTKDGRDSSKAVAPEPHFMRSSRRCNCFFVLTPQAKGSRVHKVLRPKPSGPSLQESGCTPLRRTPVFWTSSPASRGTPVSKRLLLFAVSDNTCV